MAGKKMQTEEETAAAEEPILEEGSGREQVRTFSVFSCLLGVYISNKGPVYLKVNVFSLIEELSIAQFLSLLPKQPAVSTYSTCIYTLISVLFH